MKAQQCRRLVTADLAVVEAAGGFELADPEVSRTDGDPEPGRGFVVRQAAFQNRCDDTLAEISGEGTGHVCWPPCLAHRVNQITVEPRKDEPA